MTDQHGWCDVCRAPRYDLYVVWPPLGSQLKSPLMLCPSCFGAKLQASDG